jgi:predicted RNA binding protein YcfA (HicA-like mRNA interferase family)
VKTPSLNYTEILAALRRGGWIVVRQEGSHIRLRKRSTLAHILKQARLTTAEFLDLL